jgi:hypothetical protein
MTVQRGGDECIPRCARAPAMSVGEGAQAPAMSGEQGAVVCRRARLVLDKRTGLAGRSETRHGFDPARTRHDSY